MAIKNRRGPYNKFDPTKLLPGEWAVVLSGDPHASDGLACYMCFAPGTVKRMATYEDMVDNIAASSGEVVAAEVDRQCKAAIQACQTAASNAGSAASAANTAAGNANTAVGKANTAANSANTAATAANEAARAAQNVIQGDLSSNTVMFTTASTRTNILSGESLTVMFGKIKKWLSDLKAAAFCAVQNNLTTTTAGSVLDARQGKALQDKIGSTDISSIGDGTVTGAINTLNTNNVGNGQMLYVSFTLYGDNYWVSSPIPCDQADKRNIALTDNVKNPSADVNSAVSSGLFTVMKTKDAFYLITNDTAVAGYIFGTLHPNRMWLVTYNVS